MNFKNKQSSVIATGGLITALGIICVYSSSYLPTNKIFLQSIASCLILISILTTGIRNSILVYFSTAILSILFCGIKLTTISYMVFFGLYGFVKYYIERLNKIVVEYILKLFYFNLSLFALFLIYKLFFPSFSYQNTSIYIIIFASQIVFIIYDYVLTIFISYFKKRYKKL